MQGSINDRMSKRNEAARIASTSSGIELDQGLARQMLIEGAVFLFLDVPSGTEFGIDMKFWTTGEKFRGVKMIPPGLHYIYFSAVDQHGNTAPRAGIFHNFQKSEFLIRRWDPETEDMNLTEPTLEEKQRMRTNLLELDRFLGPYPLDEWKRWRALTSKITDELVRKLVPQSGVIRSALEMIACEEQTPTGEKTPAKRRRPITVEEKEEELLPRMMPSPGTALRLTSFPQQKFPEGASPAEITKCSLDSSYVLETMLAKYDRHEDIIGEMQFAFVCFLVGYSFEAFEQWKKIVDTFCRSDSVVQKYHDLYSDFITQLEVQLTEVPEDFLVDIVSSNNVVYHSLKELFRTLEESGTVDGRLKTKAGRFKQNLTDKFEWVFEFEEDDEEAPVIVEGAELLMS